MRDMIDPNAPFDTRIDALLEQLRSLESALETPDPARADGEMLARILDHAAMAVTQSTDAQLRMIDAALARMVDGHYGLCETCGAQIALERLDRHPTTTECSTCAR